MEDADDDTALLRAMAAGDERAVSGLWQRYGASVRGFGAKFLGSQADGDDLAQETFHRAWRAADRFDPEKGAVRTWLFTIARNVARDTLRRQRIRWAVGLDELTVEPEDGAPDAETQLADRDALRDVHAALLDLPDAQRMALLLATAGDLETPEIARILGRSRGAVEQLIVRARKSLRARMEEMGHA